jgi:Protein of unknown function (DUF4241)
VEALADALGETYVHTWSWANFAAGPAGESVVAFATGWGDGADPTYWGLDGRGEPAVALSDLLVVDAD